MSNRVIIHFSPVELYPPIQNFLRMAASGACGERVILLTTYCDTKGLSMFEAGSQHIQIIRLGKSGNHVERWQRWFTYLLFNLGAVWVLLRKRPSKVLYYESLSAFPAYVYKRFINTKAFILVHYHEYATAAEYKNGMWLNRWFHRLECWLYPRVSWLSHTNEERMRFFQEDILPIQLSNPQVVPNYPPTAWEHIPKAEYHKPLKIIYIGSLSLDTMYTKEMAEWIIAQNGSVNWDIYSQNITTEARYYLESIRNPSINLHHALNYDQLVTLLPQYDIGVILYKGHMLNYIWNAPNKLFEYLICGLDVWYPDSMKGISKYDSVEFWPKVVRLNFSMLANEDWAAIRERKEGMRRRIATNCEEANNLLVQNFCG